MTAVVAGPATVVARIGAVESTGAAVSVEDLTAAGFIPFGVQYQIRITGSDGAGALTQTVSGTTLTASFTVDYAPDWSVTVQAQNAVGWGPASTVVRLGGL